MNYLIGIDVGTSATKTVLFDENGQIKGSVSCEYPLYQPENGWAEQKAEDWRDAVLKTLKEVMELSGVPAEEVKGIGISGQMHGLVMLDEQGEVLRPSIIWCDQRTGEEVEDMLRIMPRERWIQITANPPLTGWTAAKILWVRKHEPEIYSQMPSYLTSERLYPLHIDRCICNGSVRCQRYAAVGCSGTLLVRRSFRETGNSEGMAGNGL